MNPASWIILGLILVAVGIALFFIFKKKSVGCSCCKKDCPYRSANKKIKS